MKALRLLTLLLATLFAVPLLGQDQVTWKAELVPADARAGESAQVVLTATIKETWHLYSLKPVKDGPQATVIKVGASALEPQGDAVEPTPIREKDENFGVVVGYFVKRAKFGVPVRIKSGVGGKQSGQLDLRWMACNPELCTPVFDTPVKFDFTVAAGPARPERMAAITTIPQQPAQASGTPKPGNGEPVDEFQKEFEDAKSQGILAYMVFCFIGGLLALLTPCVFPMIPITVSFFSKRGDAQKKDIRGAVAYCIGIIATFTALGVLVSVVFGATGINALANNPWINGGLFVLFVVLALSLFGVYEFRLPSGFVNKASSASRQKSGLLGPVLMGFAFTLTSFTCAVPVVGTLLALAAQGSLLYPILGMFSFSLAFAAPFFLLAVFPQYLAQLPKSGGWLTSVKVFLGFAELLFAVKFLSNIDLFWSLGLIPRTVFLAIWVALSALCASWLLGWFRFPHEGAEKPGFVRRIFGVGSIAIAIWFLGGIDGRSLGELNGFLPPEPYPGRTTVNAAVPWMHDYTAALARSKAENKPVFINFTGVNCTNCRWMEANMFPRKDVSSYLVENFIPLELWTDRPTTEDRANQKIQLDTTKTVILPIYAVVGPDGKAIKIFSKSTRNPEEFLAFLKSASDASTAVATK